MLRYLNYNVYKVLICFVVCLLNVNICIMYSIILYFIVDFCSIFNLLKSDNEIYRVKFFINVCYKIFFFLKLICYYIIYIVYGFVCVMI